MTDAVELTEINVENSNYEISEKDPLINDDEEWKDPNDIKKADDDDGIILGDDFDFEFDDEDLGQVYKKYFPISPSTRSRIEKISKSSFVRLSVVLLIFVDLLVMCVEFSVDEDKLNQSAITAVGLFTLTFLTMEIVAELLWRDFWAFVKDMWSMLDMIVTIIAILSLLDSIGELGEYAVLLRIVRIVRRAARVIRLMRNISKQREQAYKAMRMHVAKGRVRYTEHGFNLDLSKISEKIYAMSVPAVGKDALFLNPATEVSRFFRKKHAGNFIIYNLSPEKIYPYHVFNNRVAEYFIEHKNPASLQTVYMFCRSVDNFLKANDKRVVAIHDVQGIGRTTFLCAAYLMWQGKSRNAKDAVAYFARRRLTEIKAVPR